MIKLAYKIILPFICVIQTTLLDFIGEKTIQVIDCRTTEGRRQYIHLFGRRAFEKKIKPSLGLSRCNSYSGEFILNPNLLQHLFSQLSERAKRLVAGLLFLSVRCKKKDLLNNVLDVDPKTARKGANELLKKAKLDKKRDRIVGGGRKSKIDQYDNLLKILDSIADDHIAGDPMSQKRGVRKSLKYFKGKLGKMGIRASQSTIRKYLRKLKINLKGNAKVITTSNKEERNRQFDYINRKKKEALKAGTPLISVDTKKKENIGLFRNLGKIWDKTFKRVFGYDFPSLGKGKMTPYGVYDIKNNNGYMYCGITSDTPKFAVAMITKWWKEFGQNLFPDAKELVILCDGGGSNGYRVRGWKYELYKQLATPFNLKIRIYHYPTGCSKYNPIERRLFSFITINWAGEPLESLEKVIHFINNTTTEAGLTVQGFIIEEKFATGINYSDEQMNEIKMRKSSVLSKWNYSILPA